MLESSFQHLVAANHLPDLLVVQLRRFTYSLTVQGYADETVRLKVKLVTKFVQWLKRKRLIIADLHERLVEAFLKRRHRERRGDLRTSSSFSIICEGKTLFQLEICLVTGRHWIAFSTGTKHICAQSAGLSPTPSWNTSLSFVSFSWSASSADRFF